jgi:AcrR family transcriptional regulator
VNAPSAAELTRARILDAAAGAFAHLGFEGASTRALAEAAGVNIATLAYHFGDKQGLYEATIERVYARLLAVELELDALPPVPADRVRTLVARLYRVARAHANEIRILLRNVLDTRSLPASVHARWMPAVLAKVQTATSALQLPPGDHRLALLSVNHLLARYAVTEADDLVLFTGAGDAEGREAEVAEWLGEAAVRMLGLGG